MSQHDNENGVSHSLHNDVQVVPKDKDFYEKAQKYWSTVPATVNGMLGGLGYISSIDIQGSKTFIYGLKDLGNQIALDCGAGIGRVSKNLLMPRFRKTDIVEQDGNFAKKAHEFCTNEGKQIRLGEIYNVGLQEFVPTRGKYDLIWCQWVLGHLTNEDLISFFRRMCNGLTAKGYLVIKENVTSSHTIEKDENDSSVTRPLQIYESFLQSSGFRIVRSFKQQGFPKELYPVYMIACQAAQ